MERAVKWKFIGNVVLTLLAAYLLIPTFWALKNPDHIDKMPSWMPKTAMKLGLDLQGGIHMVMGIDLDKVVTDQLTTTGRNLEKFLEKENIPGVSTSVLAKNFELEVKATDEAQREKIADVVTKNFQNLEFVGQTGNILVARFTRTQEDFIRTKAIEQSIETIRNRIDEFGVAEPAISRKGDSQILVQFPGAKEPERLKALIGQTAQLTFAIVHECKDGECMARWTGQIEGWIKDAEKAGNYNRDAFKRLSDYRTKINEDLKAKLPADTTIAFEKIRDVNVNGSFALRPYLLSTKHVLSGEYIENAYVTMGSRDKFSMGGEIPEVAFQMNPVGAPLLGNLTGEFTNRYMAIVLDGMVKSAPVINSQIKDSGVITLGRGSIDEIQKEANDLSLVLRAGALPASIEVQEERVIGPSIGRDAIVSGTNALLVASVLIFAFMWLYYSTAGLIASIVTAINVGMIVAVLGALGATLTLPGIAGIVLTIGMAVDALIIIYERMREEVRLGRGVRQTIALGFDHAFATILDSNVTTAIGAFVLLEYGTGSIRGFALTLLVGITVNVFMATFFAHNLYDVLFQSNLLRQINVGLSKKELQEIHA